MKQQQDSKRLRPLNQSLVSRFLGYLERYITLDRELADSDQEISRLTDSLLVNAAENNASDIHLDSEHNEICIRMRVDGRLLDATVLDRQVDMRLLSRFKVMTRIDPVWPHKPVEGWTEYRLGERLINLRISCVPAIAGEKMTIRLLDPTSLHLSVEKLGLDEEQYSVIKRWLDGTRGMFLVVGAIGSGKTTTLYSLLEQLRVRQRSVITIEDPVEYHLDGTTQMQVDLRRGMTFDLALRSILRIDPDYIMVGEVRDPVSAHAAVSASTSGKILLTTLHSRDAVGAITSLRNFDVKDYDISAAVEFIVAQRLVRRLCVKCRHRRPPVDDERYWFKLVEQPCPEEVWVASGCDHCHNTGYLGRTGIFEVWQIDAKANEMILSHVDERTMRKKIREQGVSSILQDGVAKVAKGITSIDEIRSAALLGPLDEQDSHGQL